MIKLMRVDDRLLHGQVAFSWLNYTKAKRIVIANDKYANDPMLKTSLLIGKPPNVDLRVLTVERTADFFKNRPNDETLLIVQTVDDAYRMVNLAQDYISNCCLGGVRDDVGKKLVFRQVYLSEPEINMLKEMMQSGIEVFAQDVPMSNKATGEDIIKNF